MVTADRTRPTALAAAYVAAPARAVGAVGVIGRQRHGRELGPVDASDLGVTAQRPPGAAQEQRVAENVG